MNRSNLILHTGASAVERGQLATVAAPARTETWVPIPHDRLLSGIIGSLESTGMSVVGESHGLTKDGARYFGLLQIVNDDNVDDFGMVTFAAYLHPGDAFSLFDRSS